MRRLGRPRVHAVARHVAHVAGAVEARRRDAAAARAAVGFYHEAFGWTAETDAEGPVPYTACHLGQEPVAGILGRTPNVPADAPDSWSVYFAVGDCSAVTERGTELGGSVIVPPTPTPMGPFAVLADPEGAVFQIMEMSAGPPNGATP